MKGRKYIDFVANMGSKRYYIQSAFSIPDEEKRAQEKASLINVKDSFKKIIIVKDVIQKVFSEVKGQYEHFFYSELDTSLFDEE